jgi:hypothetical protein
MHRWSPSRQRERGIRQNENPARAVLKRSKGRGSREPSVECLEIISCYEGSARETRRRHRGSCRNRATEAAYFNSCNAEAHSRSGSRSPGLCEYRNKDENQSSRRITNARSPFEPGRWPHPLCSHHRKHIGFPGKGPGVARIFKVRKDVKGGHNSCDDQVSKRPPCRHLGANTPHVEDERTATPWGTRAGDPNR